MMVFKTYGLKSTTKGLLSVAFLLGIFSFSSYVGHTSSEQAIHPIELVSASKSAIGKRTIAYKKALAQRANHLALHFAKSEEMGLRTAYNQRDKVKFDSYCDQFYITLPIRHFYRAKNIPQNTEAHPSAFPLG